MSRILEMGGTGIEPVLRYEEMLTSLGRRCLGTSIAWTGGDSPGAWLTGSIPVPGTRDTWNHNPVLSKAFPKIPRM